VSPTIPLFYRFLDEQPARGVESSKPYLESEVQLCI